MDFATIHYSPFTIHRNPSGTSDFPSVLGGFPHSEIVGSKGIRTSPTLIAAYHVLHRLCMPRHPPIALKTLDCSHCQYPSSRIRIREKIKDLPEPARNGDWTLKDQLLEICSMARLGKPIMWLELSIHSRRISKWINPNKSSLYDVKQNRHRTNHIGSTQTLANDCILVSTPNGGAGRDRTDDPLLAKQVLSQLSYGPLLVKTPRITGSMVGLDRLELSTSPLSGVRSNHLSYRP